MYVPLPYDFNFKTLVQLAEELSCIPFNHKIQFVSFDVTNMYSNVPTRTSYASLNSSVTNSVSTEE